VFMVNQLGRKEEMKEWDGKEGMCAGMGELSNGSFENDLKYLKSLGKEERMIISRVYAWWIDDEIRKIGELEYNLKTRGWESRNDKVAVAEVEGEISSLHTGVLVLKSLIHRITFELLNG